MHLGSTAIGLCCRAISWFLLDRVGRRRLYLAGMLLVAVYAFIIGFLEIPNGGCYELGQAALCLVWLGTFPINLSPCGWVIPAEISSTRLRRPRFWRGMPTASMLSLPRRFNYT